MTSKTMTAALLTFLATGAPVAAQTLPHHSGHMSFNAPQMRHPGSGLHRPNRPSYHHFRGHSGYRPVHPGGHR